MQEWETALLRYMSTSHPDVMKALATGDKISDDLAAKLKTDIEAFNSTWA